MQVLGGLEVCTGRRIDSKMLLRVTTRLCQRLIFARFLTWPQEMGKHLGTPYMGVYR